MKRNAIEFAAPSASLKTVNDPAGKPAGGYGGKPLFRDLVLIPELSGMKAKFAEGEEWWRILPAIADRSGNQEPVFAFEFQTGKIGDTTLALAPNSRAMWDLYKYAKSNNQLDRLQHCPRPKDTVAMWAVRCEKKHPDGNTPASLHILIASAYDGIRGGACGLGNDIMTLLNSSDEEGNPIDTLSETGGRKVSITKTKAPGRDQYPSYRIKLGNNPAPLSEIMATVSDEEYSKLRPLQSVIRFATEDEIWDTLISENRCTMGEAKTIRGL